MPERRVVGTNGVRLASVFCPECIQVIDGKPNKQAVLEQLVRSLADARLLTHTEVTKLANTLMERESHGTTALGKGLAIPHLRTEAVYRFVGAVGLAPTGVDFLSLDGAPTKLIFLVLAPYEQREQQFELMGRLSALMRDKSMLMFLQGRRTPREVYEYLQDLDARASESPQTATVLSTTRTTAIHGSAELTSGRG